MSIKMLYMHNMYIMLILQTNSPIEWKSIFNTLYVIIRILFPLLLLGLHALSLVAQLSGWAREHVQLLQWYSSQASLGDQLNCLVCHLVAAPNDCLRHS